MSHIVTALNYGTPPKHVRPRRSPDAPPPLPRQGPGRLFLRTAAQVREAWRERTGEDLPEARVMEILRQAEAKLLRALAGSGRMLP